MTRALLIGFLSLCILSSTSVLGLIIGRDPGAALLPSYDYVICGCGVAGLVVARRLSEDPRVNVLCIEAGPEDQYEDMVLFPRYANAMTMYNELVNTMPQSQLDGQSRFIPQARVLGGGSVTNGMVWARGDRQDYDAWEQLGNQGWGWDDLLPYFQKSENYTPNVDPTSAEIYQIHYDPSVHGQDGPVHISYPDFIWPESANFFRGLNDLGVLTAYDPSSGNPVGAAFVPQAIHPENQTRSDARRAYYDPVASRQNLHVLVSSTVTRVLLEGYSDPRPATPSSNPGMETGPSTGNTVPIGYAPLEASALTRPPTRKPRKKARRIGPDSSQQMPGYEKRDPSDSIRVTGVEYATDAASQRSIINATREVILAAGALHSPQILMLSGIGPQVALDRLNITVAINAPGVGQNLQDHCLFETNYTYGNSSHPSPWDLQTNRTLDNQYRQQYLQNKTGPWTAGAMNALAFPPLSSLGLAAGEIVQAARQADPTASLPPGLPRSITDAYSAQRASTLERISQNTSTGFEIINNNYNSLNIAIMLPLSRGYMTINSSDPFQPPSVNPRWLSDPFDRNVVYQALLMNRRLLEQSDMAVLEPDQITPGVYDNESTLLALIDSQVRTEFHPSGTTAMLPIEQGGVVDTDLLVYGTQNLRVVDAGVFPIIPAAHLQAPVYAVAEKAADIIKVHAASGSPRETAEMKARRNNEKG